MSLNYTVREICRMNLLIRLLSIFAVVCLSHVAYAEDAVLLTDDRTTTLDLMSKEGTSVDLLECNLSVLEEDGNLYLVHSKGKLLIPRLAVKRMMDEASVEVDTNGMLLGLKLVSMVLPYAREPGAISNPYKFNEIPNKDRGNAPIFPDSGMHFFVAEHESKIAATIKRKLPKTRFIPTKDLENGNEVILLNPAYLHPVGGYPLSDYFLSEWLRKPPLIQIDYNCGVRVEKTANPYFKKQDEIFRFGH